MKPSYAAPDDDLVKRSLDEMGGQVFDEGEWELAEVRVDSLVPTEWAEAWASQVRAMKEAPHLVAPIVVRPRRGDGFTVIDGHHRLDAAKKAGHKALWVVVLVR